MRDKEILHNLLRNSAKKGRACCSFGDGKRKPFRKINASVSIGAIYRRTVNRYRRTEMCHFERKIKCSSLRHRDYGYRCWIDIMGTAPDFVKLLHKRSHNEKIHQKMISPNKDDVLLQKKTSARGRPPLILKLKSREFNDLQTRRTWLVDKATVTNRLQHSSFWFQFIGLVKSFKKGFGEQQCTYPEGHRIKSSIEWRIYL